MAHRALGLASSVLAPAFLESGAQPSGPPPDPSAFREPDLVEPVKLAPTIRLDVRAPSRPVRPRGRGTIATAPWT